MLVIAHRGANKEALENSWSAFAKAVECGAQRIELDVQLSKDGHAVIMHDDDMFKTTGQHVHISRLERSELRTIKLRNGEPLPFLDEVIERLLPQIELNIEIKGESEQLAAVVANLVAKNPRRERVIVSCFQSPPLVWLRRNAPEVQRACLWSLDTYSWPFFATLAPTVFLEIAGTNILHPHTSLVDYNLMDQAAARNWRVYAWAEMVGEDHDREGLWTTLKTFGLHGLCTNYPRELTQWLKESAAYDQLIHD
ncbi:MAG: glycerophosphodiester phosphodiesterase [Proteobacteria bacterium]|nr:glycerophosphodiester phosphodiesterase [Pseudomonadota bacterium]